MSQWNIFLFIICFIPNKAYLLIRQIHKHIIELLQSVGFFFLHIPLKWGDIISKLDIGLKKIKLHFYRAKIPLKICCSKRIPWLRSGFWIAEEERKKWQTPLTLSHSPFKTIEKNMKSFVFGVINNRIHVFFFAK